MKKAGRVEMALLLILGLLMGAGTLTFTWAVTAKNGWLSKTTSPATLAFVDTEEGVSWEAVFEKGIAGNKTVRLQALTIVTTLTQVIDGQVVPMTDGHDKAEWVTVSMAIADPNGKAKFKISAPLAVQHTYRAIVNPGPTEVVTNTVDWAMPQPNLGTGLATMYVNTNEGDAIVSTDLFWEGQVSIVPGTGGGPCQALAPALSRITGRGNYTWTLEKKPYNFNLDKSADLCGLGKAGKWTLLANHYDRSLMRTSLAMYLGNQMDAMAFNPKTVPVDLVMNGVYQGSYTLIERVEINKLRVNIDQLDDTKATPAPDWNSPPTVTGGYLLEWDFRGSGTQKINVGDRGNVRIREPQEDVAGQGITPQQVAYITDYVLQADKALYGPNFKDPVNGWRKYIDEKSAVDLFLLEEFSKNIDANMYSSVYMYKTRDTAAGPGKLFMGPAWDFDTSFGDCQGTGQQGDPTGWYLRDYNPEITAKQTDEPWFNRLNEDPGFRAAVTARWKQLAPVFGGIGQYVDQQSAAIAKSAEKNFTLWPVNQRLEDVQEIKGSWPAEVAYLKDWSAQRLAWMNSQLK